MDEAEARARIEMMVAASSDPTLEVGEVDALVAIAKRADPFGNSPANVDTAPVWQASTAYVAGDIVTAAPAAGRWWRCLVPGTSAADQPDWPDQSGKTPGDTTVTDGGITWVDAGTAWAPTWNLAAAAAEGWTLKAGKAANRFAFTTDGQTFQRQQLVAHCRQMAAEYRRRLIAGIP